MFEKKLQKYDFFIFIFKNMICNFCNFKNAALFENFQKSSFRSTTFATSNASLLQNNLKFYFSDLQP